jgi:mono/diheme cytochrome c family protein
MRSLMLEPGRLRLLLYATVAACCVPAFVQAGESDPQAFGRVEKGRYLALVSDCSSCHTAPGGGRPFAGGRAIETPFGNVVATNITPDRDTGIGAWTDDEFDAAVRRGLRRDGSRLYPAMPYNDYTKMSRDDVLAIRSYLNTIQPVSNAVDADLLPFPFNIRAAVGVWDALYFTDGAYQPDPEKSAEWNRGAYLVNGPGHCGACHTPKSTLGGDKSSHFLQGADLQGWFAPNITADVAQGLGRWSGEDIITYLRTGHNRISAATGPMAEVVALSSSHMTGTDLTAIATYLKSLAAVSDPPQALSSKDPAMISGAAIFRDQCSACHALDGHGTAQLFPSLADSALVRSSDPATLIRIVLRGARSVATDGEPTGPGMPSYAWQLDDAEVAAVLTYIRNSWGSAAGRVSAEDVSQAKAQLRYRPD